MAAETKSPFYRAYLAISLDGFIADRDGGVKWLDKYNHPSLGFATFFKSIDTVVVGRTTYEQAISWGGADTGKRTIVMTRRPLDKPPASVETFSGDVRSLAQRLKREKAGQVWLMGGGQSISPFHEANLVNRWELFVIPVLLRDGVPLFAREAPGVEALELTKCKRHIHGIVELHYVPKKRSRAAPPVAAKGAKAK